MRLWQFYRHGLGNNPHRQPHCKEARAGEQGTNVVWSDEIDVAADTLWRLAQKQARETMTLEPF